MPWARIHAAYVSNWASVGPDCLEELGTAGAAACAVVVSPVPILATPLCAAPPPQAASKKLDAPITAVTARTRLAASVTCLVSQAQYARWRWPRASDRDNCGLAERFECHLSLVESRRRRRPLGDRQLRLTKPSFVNLSCFLGVMEVSAIDDPSTGLAAVVTLRRLADRLEDAQVERALRNGWNWPQVAEALGVTRQAVYKKHARRLGAAGVP